MSLALATMTREREVMVSRGSPMYCRRSTTEVMAPRRLATPSTHCTVLGTGVMSPTRSTPLTWVAGRAISTPATPMTTYCTPRASLGATPAGTAPAFCKPMRCANAASSADCAGLPPPAPKARNACCNASALTCPPGRCPLSITFLALLLYQAAHAGDEVATVKRLGEIHICPLLHPPVAILWGVLAAEQDDGDLAAFVHAFQFAADLEAALFGQHDIQHDAVGALDERFFDGLI